MYANDEPFKEPETPENGSPSMPVVLPFSVYLNDNHSIDLEFYQSVGEVEIEISQGGIVILSYSEDITSLMLRNIQLQSDAFGWFVIH